MKGRMRKEAWGRRSHNVLGRNEGGGGGGVKRRKAVRSVRER